MPPPIRSFPESVVGCDSGISACLRLCLRIPWGMADYAKLRSDLVSSSTVIEGATLHNVKDPVTGSYFRLREPEYWLIQQLDGDTSCDEIAARFVGKFGLDITAEAVEQFVVTLEKLFFLEGSRSEQAISRRSYPREERGSLFSRLLFIKVKAFKPGRFLERLTTLYRPFHNRYVFACQLALIALGLAILFANAGTFTISLIEVFNLGSIVTIVVAFFVFVAVHEFAHAVICRLHGGEVREMGFLLLYFQPCFYSDLSDAWLFEKKRHRLAVTWAGPYCQLVLLAAAVIIWRVTVIGTPVNELARIVAIVSWVTMLFNFNPLIKLDGYYLLSDAVDIPNLRRKSFAYFGNVWKRRILGWPVDPLSVRSREKRIFLLYAVFAVAYSTFLIAYVLTLVGQFLLAKLGGAGLLLLIVALLFTLRSNIAALARGTAEHVKQMRKMIKSPLRLTVYLVLALAVVAVLIFLPFSRRVTGEVVVRPIAECTLLLNELGLLETRFRRGGDDTEKRTTYLQMTTTEMASLELVGLVKDGQSVATGDTVAVLISNQVVREIAAQTSVLERLESELALLRAPPRKEEVAEADADLAAAETNVAQLKRDQTRVRELSDKNLSTATDMETAQSALEIAQAERASRQARLELLKAPPKPEAVAMLEADIERQKGKLSFLKSQQAAQSIRAPISGTVVIGHGSDEILSIVNDVVVELLVPVSDFDIGLIELEQDVRIKVRTHPGELFFGRVAHIPGTAELLDQRTSFLVSVTVDNPDRRLRKGMTGYAKIETGSSSLVGLVLRRITSYVRVEFWSWW